MSDTEFESINDAYARIDENKFLIINDHSSNVFLDSRVNVFRYGLFNCEMIYNQHHQQRFVDM